MTKKFVNDKQLVVIAVAQEQHSDRTRLYAQWKNLNWKIAYDPLNKLALRSVPMAIAIDENGQVASRRISKRFLTSWMKSETKPEKIVEKLGNRASDLSKKIDRIDSFQFGKHWKKVQPDAGWNSEKPDFNTVITRYQNLAKENPTDARLQFRLGVAYRMRYDSSKEKKPSDFQTAVDHWTKALQLDPGHYIFRRRIQQYGPRLEKPYPFYDWVDQARKEIQETGKTPIPFNARLTGSEIARPARKLSTGPVNQINPDPNNKIPTTGPGEVKTQITVVPSVVRPGRSVRVHIKLSTDSRIADWNDEAGPSLAWIHPSTDSKNPFKLSSSLHNIPPSSIKSRNVLQKVVEFELQVPKNYTHKTLPVSAFALLNLCRKKDGVCYYGRKNFEFTIPIKTN